MRFDPSNRCCVVLRQRASEDFNDYLPALYVLTLGFSGQFSFASILLTAKGHFS